MVSQHALRQTPPVDRILDTRSENITLPQTSFVGGNNYCCIWAEIQYFGAILID